MTWLFLLALLPAADLWEDRVRPLLASKCLACHAETKAGGLRLDGRAAMLAGGKSGQAAVIPGKPDESLLVQAIEHSHARLRMPPGASKLAGSEIAAVREWVAKGAVVPAASEAGVSAWALQPLARPAAMGVDPNHRAALGSKGLAPNPRADRRTLRRRLYFDLSGLPAPAEDAGEPLERLVDQLLASRHFGERWARHWLDVARYGEDDYTGTQPKEYANAWRYRDWVIDAMNRDMPYDLFLQAQIAGDLLEPQRGFEKKDYTAGLGLFGLGPWYYGISQPPQARADERHDRVDMIGRGMLGLTVACARCHDHKYDPITMQDYYGLAGVFASSAYKEYPLADAKVVTEWDARQKKIQQVEKSLQAFLEQQTAQLAEIFARQAAQYLLASAGARPAEGLDAELLQRYREYLKKRDPQHPFLDRWHELVERKAPSAELQAAAGEFQAVLLAVAGEKKRIDEENRENVLRAKFAAPAGMKRKPIVLPFGYQSDEDFNPGADVPSKSLPRDRYQLWHRFFNMKNTLLRFEGEALTGRFLAGEWKRHVESLQAEKKELEQQNGKQYPFLHGMGEGEPWDLPVNLRGNPEALGEVAPRRLPRLLEAGLGSTGPVRLQEGSGRLQLARAVSAHPLAARVAVNRIWLHLFGSGLVRTPSNFGKVGDTPGNEPLLEYLAWRFRDSGYSVKSLVREIVLSAAYQASAAGSEANERIDGENRYFWRMNRRRLDAEAFRDSLLAAAGTLERDSYGGPSKAVTDPTNARRTIYAKAGRFRQDETLSLFDFPSASVTCEQRVSTNVPQQKLYVLNSEFVKGQAAALAARVAQGDIEGLYGFALGRRPVTREIDLAREFLRSAEWVELAQVLLSSNEFAFID